MEKINKYFQQFTDDLTFIELKDNTSIKVNNHIVEAKVPMPILMDSLIKEVKEGNIEEEINLARVIEGIIYLLGTDQEFKFKEEYINILKAYNEKIEDYIFYKGLKSFEEENYDLSGIYYRALLTLNQENINGLFNYALVLEQLAKNYIADDKTEEATEFLLYSTNRLETILDIDESYSLAYYKLGFHYKFLQQFLKAKLIWGKFLLLDKDELRLQEVREEIELIDDDVDFETGMTYLTYNDFGKALDSFLKLIPKYEKQWNVNYLIGLCYKGIEDYDYAIDYLNKAIELDKEQADIYNELGIIHFNMDDILQAIKIFGQGIENCPEDYKLYFNRGLGYVQLGQYELALKDIEKASSLNPDEENIIMQKSKLLDLLESI